MAEKEIYKVISLGDSGVGKTSIFKRYALGIFEEDNLSTVGVGFSFKEVTLKNGWRCRIVENYYIR